MFIVTNPPFHVRAGTSALSSSACVSRQLQLKRPTQLLSLTWRLALVEDWHRLAPCSSVHVTNRHLAGDLGRLKPQELVTGVIH